MAVPAALEAILQAGTGQLAKLLELDLPDTAGGTTNYKKWSKGGYASASGGWYDDRVTRWGSLGWRASDARSGTLEGSRTTVEVRDDDFELAKIVEGAVADKCYGSPARIKLAETSLTSSNWWPAFVGVLESWTPRARGYTLELRTDDMALERYQSSPLTQANFPAAEPSVWGKGAPRIYGRHRGVGIVESGGAVPTLPFDVARDRHLIAAGWLKAVPGVWAGPTQVTTGFTIERNVEPDGLLYTSIRFTTAPPEGAITCDVDGYETVGDGSGTLIENPADQFAHFLTNWVLKRCISGNWFATDSRISSSHLTAAAAYFNGKAIKGSRYLPDSFLGRDEVAEWCKTWNARAWWEDGKIALAVPPHVIADVYPSSRLYRDEWHDISGSFAIEYRQRIIDRVRVKHLLAAATGQYAQTLEVRDPLATRRAEEALEMPWSYAAVA